MSTCSGNPGAEKIFVLSQSQACIAVVHVSCGSYHAAAAAAGADHSQWEFNTITVSQVTLQSVTLYRSYCLLTVHHLLTVFHQIRS